MTDRPDPFTVTTPATTVQLGDDRRTAVNVSITNVTGRSLRARLRAVPVEPAKAEWFAIAGDAERQFDLGATVTYSVGVTVPGDVPSGSYQVRFDAEAEDRPQEDFTAGPVVAVSVTDAEHHGGFPWWIVAVAAAVVVVGVVVAFLIVRSGDDEPAPVAVAVPNVVGLPLSQARQAVEGVGLTAELAQLLDQSTTCDPVVELQNPVAAAMVDEGSVVALAIKRFPPPLQCSVRIPEVRPEVLEQLQKAAEGG